MFHWTAIKSKDINIEVMGYLVERQLAFAASPQTRWMNVLEDRRERSTGALFHCGNISQTKAHTIMMRVMHNYV